MRIEDKLYGVFEVESVLAQLIRSEPMQRLKRVHQGGAIFLVDSAINHTRYAHSLGVLFLVKYLGGSMEEQIAALTHDVSHTAFSHVADYVFGYVNEDYHESIFEEVINKSEIPEILNRFGFDAGILFGHDYPILEQPLPLLCADRVDYTLRDLFQADMISLKDVRLFLPQLTLQHGRMVVKSETAGQWISDQFKQLNNAYFKKPEHVYANTLMADLLKQGLEGGLLQKDDLLKDDYQVLNKLAKEKTGYQRINEIRKLTHFKQFSIKRATERFKTRVLDPAVMR
ncbi:HD domain-containing protein [Mucilaginibacter flavus]|uniref:HD domain-containing protein n=1 Tax=Mucilaginibacter flavus TaxID=931504 RepID=UPI0025B538D5|nr:HD domain-containing protein [Mucilaginibacter flavus]MDN3583103.1 HD domain-containing protein [Mucilaginibacter flavus]